MKVLIRGLHSHTRRFVISQIAKSSIIPTLHVSQPVHARCIHSGHSSHSLFPFPPVSKPVDPLRHHLRLRHLNRGFHLSIRTRAEDAQASKPPNYPEAEWQRI